MRPDGEDGILALLVLAQLGAHAGKQNAKSERLGDVIVGARFEAQNGVGVAVGGSQHDDRHLVAGAPYDLAQLAAVDVGQADVEQHQVVAMCLDPFERRAAVSGLGDHELLVQLQLLGERLAQRIVVVDDQDSFAQSRRPIPSSHRSTPISACDVYSAIAKLW